MASGSGSTRSSLLPADAAILGRTPLLFAFLQGRAWLSDLLSLSQQIVPAGLSHALPSR